MSGTDRKLRSSIRPRDLAIGEGIVGVFETPQQDAEAYVVLMFCIARGSWSRFATSELEAFYYEMKGGLDKEPFVPRELLRGHFMRLDTSRITHFYRLNYNLITRVYRRYPADR